jgi:hypothetical protein
MPTAPTAEAEHRKRDQRSRPRMLARKAIRLPSADRRSAPRRHPPGQAGHICGRPCSIRSVRAVMAVSALSVNSPSMPIVQNRLYSAMACRRSRRVRATLEPRRQDAVLVTEGVRRDAHNAAWQPRPDKDELIVCTYCMAPAVRRPPVHSCDGSPRLLRRGAAWQGD